VTSFRTPRLLLRLWDADDETDVAALFDMRSRPEVARWLGATPRPWTDVQESRDAIARWAELPDRMPGYGLWAIVPDDVGRPVGTALLVPLPDAQGNPTDDVEVGWHLHPDAWGHGYATEAGRRLLEHAFDDLHLDVVNAVAHPGNDPSTAVMRRLGMRPRGTSDRWYGVELEWWTVP
jgi:RimJ/RimL family protein N-acetyltransferase